MKTLLAIVCMIGTASISPAAINRTVSLEIRQDAAGLQVTWTPRSAFPGEYRLYPEYQLEVSTNLHDWEPVGARVPQRLGGEAKPIVQSINHRGNDRLFVRVVDRLEFEKLWFFQLIGTVDLIDLRGADLRGAIMDDVLLGGGFVLDDADLSGASMRRSSVGYATLRGANLTGANLQEANFYGADLTGGHWVRADARGAIFGAAILNDLNLEHADLRDARAFDDTVPGIRFFNTILPDGSVRTD